METAALEVRRHPRHDVLCAVTLARDGQAHEGFILDLSEGGARVDLTSEWTLVPGAILRLRYEDPQSDVITLDTQVARVGDDYVGLQFSPEQHDAIARLLHVAGTQH